MPSLFQNRHFAGFQTEPQPSLSLASQEAPNLPVLRQHCPPSTSPAIGAAAGTPRYPTLVDPTRHKLHYRGVAVREEWDVLMHAVG